VDQTRLWGEGFAFSSGEEVCFFSFADVSEDGKRSVWGFPCSEMEPARRCSALFV
jgi:hypothetical protein